MPDRPAAKTTRRRWTDLRVGIVTDADDPEGLGRVMVSIPSLSSSDRVGWARVAVPVAGDGSGTWFVPAIGDEVLIGFEGADPAFPVVLGSMWSNAQPPPPGAGTSDVCLIRSKGGSTIEIDDRPGRAAITMSTAGGQRVELDDAANSLRIVGPGGCVIDIDAAGIRITAASQVEIQASKVTVDAGMVEVNSGMTEFSGVVKVDTLIANSVVSASYTPGTGNVM